MNGFLNLLKPPGMTSNAAVGCVRRMLPRKIPIGHGGTLDPDAAGILPLCVGKATRLFDYTVDKTKTYVAELAIGASTDTQDASGTVLETSSRVVAESELLSVLPDFIGDIWQKPPMYSAISVDGRRLYELARKGETVEIAPRQVRVESIRLLEALAPNRFLLKVECGKGVYIRTLLVDIAASLGCPAHMAFLLRTQAGIFKIEDAFALEELSPEKIESRLIPMDAPLLHIPRVDCDPVCKPAMLNGNPVPARFLSECPEGVVRVYVGGEFAGIGERDGEGVRFRAMLLERPSV